MNKSFSLQYGFTLVEILLVIAIVSVVAAIGIPIYSNALARNDLSLATTQLKQTLFRAQTQARAGIHDAVWGVHVDTDSFTLYQGDSWGTRDTVHDQAHLFPRTYDITGDTDIQFSRLLGQALSSYSITLSVPRANISSTLNISTSGAVEIESLGGGSPDQQGGNTGGQDNTSDTTAPSTIADLVASNETTDSVMLTWTSPGDDGSSGTAASYDIRFSTSVINDASWGSATPLVSSLSPQIAGSSESVVVSGLISDVSYWFGIKAADEAPNESQLSNIPNASTLAAGCVQLGYVDEDDDGYGVGSEVCVDGLSTWATQGGDCYDSNANARPNQTSWFSTHRGDGSYDYDCDEVSSRRYTGQASYQGCLSSSAACNAVVGKYINQTPPSCGGAKNFITHCSSSFDWSTFQFQYCAHWSPRTQQCR